MSRTYLLLAGGGGLLHGLDPAAFSMAQQDEGLRLLARSSAFILFVSSDTPTLQLSNGAIVVGDLYSVAGEPVRHASQLGRDPSAAAVRRNILENCWGDYIVVTPEMETTSDVSVMRSPSHACELQCIYSSLGGGGFVTSDISLAVRLGLCRRHIDFESMAHRLVYSNLKTSRTGLSGVRELLPGHTVHLREGCVRIDQSWSPWNFVETACRYADSREAAAAIRRAIESVVNTWATQDGPVLLELSGGLDSSIVGACLKQSRAKVACSTLTAPVPGADEREYGDLVAAMLGTELMTTEVAFSDASLDFPIPPAIVNPGIGALQHVADKLMEATAERVSASSYFSGAGGDTVFCYLTDASPAADAFRAAGFSQGLRTIQDLSMFHQCTYWKAGRLTLRKLTASSSPPYQADRSLMPPHVVAPEPQLHPWLMQPAGALIGDRLRIFELSATQLFRDSCARSLKRPIRMPLLSQPVIEACLRAPSWMWFSGGQNRALARQAFADVLPPTIYARKSKGTFTGFLGALYRRNRDRMLDFLLDGELHSHQLLDADALVQFAKGELPRGDGSFMRIFQLCAMENWIRKQT